MRSIFTVFASPAFLLAASAVLGGGAYWILRSPDLPEKNETFEPDRYMLPQAPTTKITLKKVPEADRLLAAEELVLGVTIGKEARAYPINMMNHMPAHKVLNDTLGGKPIIASWCDHAHNAIVYSRAVDGRTLTFGISGQLWKGSLLMYDEQTWTRWSHHLGLAKLGPLKDRTLEPIPSTVTDWKTWSRLHPDGTVAVFDTSSLHYTRKLYDDADRFVFGIIGSSTAKSWTFNELRRQPIINDHWQGEPILVVFDLASATAVVYGRRVNGTELTFSTDRPALTDQETGTTWARLTGMAIAGPLTGKQLPQLPGFVSSRQTWQVFHPAR
ncbi:MAG: DUF3179 domain-containing protein [Planctomycetes bacterium]|nr:DUF3179 domain-containing protein [Planctomycetota bacterium]